MLTGLRSYSRTLLCVSLNDEDESHWSNRNTAKNTLLSFTNHPTLRKVLCFLHPEPRSSGSGIFQNTSMKPTYHPDPFLVKMPNDTWEGCKARPRWEGLHKPMLANHRMSFLNSALSPKEQILLDNQSHPRKQLEP